MRRMIGVLSAVAMAAALITAAVAGAHGTARSASTKPTAAAPATSAVPAGMIAINGDVAQPRMLKFSELAILPQQTISVTIDGVAHTESGPYLESVLNLTTPNYLGCNKNNLLRWWILVTNKKGAATVLGVGEVDPLFGNRPAILSISQDGQFLTAVGPRLIVPGDATGTRDISNVVMVTGGMADPQLAVPGC